MRYINDAEVAALVGVDDAVEVIERAFLALANGQAGVQTRARTEGRVGKLSTVGAVLTNDGVAGAKVYTTAPDGRFSFAVVLFDPAEARWVATIDGGVLTRIRTVATSLLVARRLAPTGGSHVLTVFGAGLQAKAHCLSFADAFHLSEIRIVNRSPVPDLIRRLSRAMALRVRQLEDPDAAVSEASLVVTATRATEPLFAPEAVAQSAHITSVGATRPTARELHHRVFERADRVVVELVEQAQRESGNLLAAISEGTFSWERVLPLADLLTGRRRGRARPDEITVFESLGLGLEDVAVAALVHRRAIEADMGTELPTGHERLR